MKNRGFDFSAVKLLHEHLSLDFVNSTSNHQHTSGEYLKTYDDLVSWGVDVGLLSTDQAQHLWDTASQQPTQAAAIHQKAVVLREAIYRILIDVALKQTPKSADLDTLNVALNEATAHMRLASSEGGFRWTWDGEEAHLDYLLWRAAWATSELLMSDKLKHIGQCEGCDWLFLDMGRGHRRRWCNMNTCGNRAKARRYYQRTKDK
jgi:predicted RNA-binding Zn ribbon-like protein